MTNTPYTETGRRRIPAAPDAATTNYCATCAASAISTIHPSRYNNAVCHTCRTENPLALPHIDGESYDERHKRAIALLVPQPKAKKTRCPHYAAIRRCQAVAAEFGLDFAAKEGRRQAAALVVGHYVETCKILDGVAWERMADEISRWGLRWDAKSAWYDDAALRGAK